MSEGAVRPMDDVCPWDVAPGPSTADHQSSSAPASSADVVAGTSYESGTMVSLQDNTTIKELSHQQSTSGDPRASRKNSSQLGSCSSSSDVSIAIAEASERHKKSSVLHHYTGSAGAAMLTRNYSVGMTTINPRVKLADTARPSVSSCNFPSPQQSFDLPQLLTERLEVIYNIQTIPEKSHLTKEKQGEIMEKIQETSGEKIVAMAPLISISTIVGELTEDVDDRGIDYDNNKSGHEVETILESREIDEAEAEIAEIKSGDLPGENVTGGEPDVEEAQVVPVWEPDKQTDVTQLPDGTSPPNLQEQRDNNVNEVCPWEDE